MTSLADFRDAVRERRRAAGRTQQQLAGAVGVNAQVLSRKLNGHDGVVLTSPDVLRIVTTLAEWGALADRADAEALLLVGGVQPHAVPPRAWEQPPLSSLPGAAVTASDAARRPAGPPRPVSSMLPAPRTSLVGRERERREVATALGTARLVTLTGVGGTGKTRLALQAAADVSGRFRDGVVFVDLAPVRDPALLTNAIAVACGVPQAGPDQVGPALLAALADRELLLVLDNMEQLVEGVEVVGAVLAAAGAVRVLATSRVRLHVYGEHTVRVPPLTVQDDGHGTRSEASRLFVDRARAAGWEEDEASAPAVARICEALDGLPLAIELAAAQTRMYPPQQLLPMLTSRLRLLQGGPRDAPARQRTLLATLDWSHALLSPPAQAVLAALGVLAGRFDTPAAAAVAGLDEASVVPALDELTEHSLVEVDPGAPLPFDMFETVREYALARLVETGTEVAAHRRGLRHLLGLATVADEAGSTPAQPAAELAVERTQHNIRVALDFARWRGTVDVECLEEGLRLATAATRTWIHFGRLDEGRLMFDRLFAVDPPAPGIDPAVRTAALLRLCNLLLFTGSFGLVHQHADELLEATGRLDGHPDAALVHRVVGESYYAVGRFDVAETHFAAGLVAADRAHDAAARASALNMLGQLHRQVGRPDLARTEIGEAIRSYRGMQEHHALAASIHSLGELERDLGNLEAASDLFVEGLGLSTGITDLRNISYMLEGLATTSDRTGDSSRALVLIGAARELRSRTGVRLPPREEDELDAVVERAGSRLSVAERDARLREGHDRPLDDVVAQILGETS